MTDKYIKYRSGYKYQLAKDYHIKISIKPKADIDIQFIALDTKGKLVKETGQERYYFLVSSKRAL